MDLVLKNLRRREPSGAGHAEIENNRDTKNHKEIIANKFEALYFNDNTLMGKMQLTPVTVI